MLAQMIEIIATGALLAIGVIVGLVAIVLVLVIIVGIINFFTGG